MQILNYKILPHYYRDVAYGDKTFEIRKDEDNVQVGDFILLREYNDDLSSITFGYTGKQLSCIVSYVLRNVPEYGLKAGYCIIGLKVLGNH